MESVGEAYRKLNDYENATAAYRKAAELDPENTAYQDNLAEAELDTQPPIRKPQLKPKPPDRNCQLGVQKPWIGLQG